MITGGGSNIGLGVPNGAAQLDANASAEISDTSTQAVPHTFRLGPRTNPALTFPVATFQPEAAALNQSLDIAPSAGATAQSQNGFAWIDVCDTPVIDAVTFNATSLRLGNGNTVTSIAVVVSDVTTRKFGTGSARPLVLASDWNGSSNPQIYLSPMTGANPSIVLGSDGSDVLVGPLASTAISTSATKGFLFLPTCAGAPTGTPHFAAAGATAHVYDSTNKKIWFYDQPTGTWKGVVVA